MVRSGGLASRTSHASVQRNQGLKELKRIQEPSFTTIKNNRHSREHLFGLYRNFLVSSLRHFVEVSLGFIATIRNNNKNVLRVTLILKLEKILITIGNKIQLLNGESRPLSKDEVIGEDNKLCKSFGVGSIREL
ncbi:hypothetical protein ANN_18490 [Periplaneta americana]|uniref:Uncharacterized protein n=1 Tax=Periplaneta americana TaxID=6978 RepID=A0ABQ8SQZ9_PERAM|nr:hypothetical protein ANN_18490 [Periplaneta americana]